MQMYVLTSLNEKKIIKCERNFSQYLLIYLIFVEVVYKQLNNIFIPTVYTLSFFKLPYKDCLTKYTLQTSNLFNLSSFKFNFLSVLFRKKIYLKLYINFKPVFCKKLRTIYFGNTMRNL